MTQSEVEAIMGRAPDPDAEVSQRVSQSRLVWEDLGTESVSRSLTGLLEQAIWLDGRYLTMVYFWDGRLVFKTQSRSVPAWLTSTKHYVAKLCNYLGL